MSIQLPQGFKIGSIEPIDSRLTLTKAEMLSINDNTMPDVYFTVCKDDSKMYIYNKANEMDPETGKFKVLESGEKRNAYDSISKVKDYLYEVHYSDLDYDYANEWFKYSNDTTKPGACSSARSGKWYIRNFDWFYNKQANFIIKTPRMNGKFASIGVGGNVAELTDEVVSSHAYNENYKIIPFKLLDGINEYGVFANTNVVPNQYGETTGTIPAVEQKMELCNLAIPRFVLDNFKTAREAVEYIRDYVSVYCYSPLYSFFKEDVHVMIGDDNETYVMEFVENEVKIELCDRPIMTNFFRYGIEWNEDGSVYTPEMFWADGGKNPITVNKITSHGNGLERHNLINSVLDQIPGLNREEVRSYVEYLYYTNAYKEVNPIWYSEVAGENERVDITLDSSEETFKAAFEVMKQMFAERSRDTGDTWQTVHSCIYDLDNKHIYLVSQEDGEEIEISFDYYTREQIDRLFVKKNELDKEIPSALKKALSEQSKQNSGIAVDDEGNISVQLNEEHLEIIDNKIDLAVSLIQAIDSN